MPDPANEALHPTSGARFVLERASAGAAHATYRCAIYTPDAVYEATAVLGEDASVQLPSTGAPDDLDSTLAMFAKLVARGAAKRREDRLLIWPARVTRWRP